MAAEDVLTVSDMAAELGVSRRTVHNWIKAYSLPVRRLPVSAAGVFVADRAEFEAWVRYELPRVRRPVGRPPVNTA